MGMFEFLPLSLGWRRLCPNELPVGLQTSEDFFLIVRLLSLGRVFRLSRILARIDLLYPAASTIEALK